MLSILVGVAVAPFSSSVSESESESEKLSLVSMVFLVGLLCSEVKWRLMVSKVETLRDGVFVERGADEDEGSDVENLQWKGERILEVKINARDIAMNVSLLVPQKAIDS